MQQDEQQKPLRSYATKREIFEPRPEKIDIEEFGPWIVERDRKVFEMLEEYDRRQKSRKSERE